VARGKLLRGLAKHTLLPLCSYLLASCSKEDKDLFAALLKPCMDISMWKGYDATDHSKNAAYYEIWHRRDLAAGAAIKDTFNKYQVSDKSLPIHNTKSAC